MKKNILITEDHASTLYGIKTVVEGIDETNTVRTAMCAKEAISILNNERIDILLTDLEMKEVDDGIELSRHTKAKFPEIKVIVITQHSEPWIIAKLVLYDVDAIVLKSNLDMDDIKKSFKAIDSKKKYYSDEIKKSFFNNQPNKKKYPFLTAREKEVLNLICDELTTQKIASKLSIADSTVESHRKNLFTKLKVKSQSGLVREAIRFGFYNL